MDQKRNLLSKDGISAWIGSNPKTTIKIMFSLLILALLTHIYTGYIKKEEPKINTAMKDMQEFHEAQMEKLKSPSKTSFNGFELLDKVNRLEALEKEVNLLLQEKVIDTVKLEILYKEILAIQ